MAGPGHANVKEIDVRLVFHFHFYDATNRGRSRLAMMNLKYDEDGWPEVIPIKEQTELNSEN